MKHSGTKLYYIWGNMRSRCNSSTNVDFYYYGGRGIKVCAEWDTYIVFKEWALLNGYKEGLSIDRTNGDKGYCPTNCTWTTRQKQAENRKKRSDGKNKYIGVYRRSTGAAMFCVTIGIKGKQVSLGDFQSEEEGAKHRDAYIIANGLAHTLNFPKGQS